MNIGDAGYYVSLQRFMRSDTFDFVFQGDELMALRLFGEIIEARKILSKP